MSGMSVGLQAAIDAKDVSSSAEYEDFISHVSLSIYLCPPKIWERCVLLTQITQYGCTVNNLKIKLSVFTLTSYSRFYFKVIVKFNGAQNQNNKNCVAVQILTDCTLCVAGHNDALSD